MKRLTSIFSIIMTFAMVCKATDATWTDTDGDHDWGNPANWSTLALPEGSDKATFPALVNAVADYVVNMNGNRSIREIVISGTGAPQINGLSDTLTLAGSITGGKGAQFNTLVIFTTDATIRCTDSWGGKTILAGGAQGAVTVSSTGNQNNSVDIVGGVYAVTNTEIRASSSTIQDCIMTNVLVTLGCIFSDSNGNRTGLNILSTANISNTVIAIDKNAGNLSFKNSTAPETVTHTFVKKILHRQGNLGLRNEVWGGTNLVTIQDFVCEPGAFVKITNSKNGTAPSFDAGVNAGFIITGAVNVNGTYKPNFMYDYYLTKINEYGAIVSCNPSTDYTVLPVTSYDPTKMYRQNTVADIALTEDSEVWAWLVDKSGDIALNLGDYDMTIGSGNMAFNGTGIKSITSSGGKLVIGEDDFIIYANGNTGSLTFSAPLAWRKPAGSTVQYPSLIFSGTGLPEVIFSGTDEIKDYNALNAEGGKSITSIIFDGPSDRNFHGNLSGRNKIYKRGTGTLTFSGADERRSASFYAESGTTILAHNDAPQVYSLTNGAVCIVADGINFAKRVYVYDGGIFCMAGTTASVGYQPIYAGGRIEGGAPGEVGIFKGTADIQPYGDFTANLKIGENSSSLIDIENRFIIPDVTGGITLTVRVEDISNGAANIRNGDVYTVMKVGSFYNTGNTLNLAIENGSPNSLDTSAAQASYDISEKTITVTGLRSLRGTVFIVR